MRLLRQIVTFVCVAFIANPVVADNSSEVKKRLKNDPYMIPYYSGMILPTPRTVSYGKNFLPLAETGILLGKGISKIDKRLKILLDRITKYGGKYTFVDSLDNDCGTIFSIGDTSFSRNLKIPPNPQGYAVACRKINGKNIVSFNGNDYLGLTWAINSIIQMITFREGETVMRSFECSDSPYLLNRGILGSGIKDNVAASKVLPVLTKLNQVYFSKTLLVPRRSAPKKWIDWRFPRPKELTDNVAVIGDNLKGLGINWEVGIMPFAIGTTINDQVQIDCKSENHFNVVWNMCLPVLKAGGGIHYTPDDYRFPISPGDKKNFGSAREADIYFINRLHKKIKENFPNATMSIVQPFYWGPTGRNPWSNESSTAYLKGIGERLPKDIAIAWTGPSVKTLAFTKQDVAKYAKLIKRKPYLFQNSSDFYHMFRFIYPGDAVSWWLGKGRVKEVYKELDGVAFNSLGLYPNILWDAMLWNPDGYDAKKTAYHATCKLIGPENYKKLKKIVEKLAWFDQFDRLKATPYAARKFKEIERRIAELKKLNDEYENGSSHPVAIKKWASLSWPIRCVDVILYQGLKRNDNLRQFVFQGAETEKLAKKEFDFNIENDQLFTAYSFSGANAPQKIYGRYATWIYGLKSKTPTMTLSFSIEPYPPTTDYDLLICGRDGGGNANCGIEISLNGKKIFRGPNPFDRKKWSIHSFKIPLPALQRGNKLTVTNIEDSAKSGVPFFVLNYAVIRKIAKSDGKRRKQ